MSLLGPVTDADRRVWQRRDLDALTRIVELTTAATLPPITWTLTGSGVHGRVGAYYDGEHDQAAVWHEWAAALRTLCGEPEWERHTPGFGGTVHHTAKFVLRLTDRGWPRCDVSILADVTPADDDAVTGEEC
jgi:hypothetical protein